MKCDDGGTPMQSARITGGDPRRCHPLSRPIDFGPQVRQLLAHAPDARAPQHDVGQQRDPDEPVGGTDQRARRDLLAQRPGHLLELLRERERGHPPSERCRTAPPGTRAESSVVHEPVSSRSSASSCSDASSARAPSSRRRSMNSSAQTSSTSANDAPERRPHSRVERRDHGRLRVNRPPDVDALVDQRHVDRREQRQRRRQLPPRRPAVPARQQVRDHDQLQQQGAGEPRVPLPPDAPGLAPPERPGDQRANAEQHGQLAADAATRSPASEPLKRYAMLPPAQTNVDRNSIVAQGTWK